MNNLIEIIIAVTIRILARRIGAIKIYFHIVFDAVIITVNFFVVSAIGIIAGFYFLQVRVAVVIAVLIFIKSCRF